MCTSFPSLTPRPCVSSGVELANCTLLRASQVVPAGVGQLNLATSAVQQPNARSGIVDHLADDRHRHPNAEVNYHYQLPLPTSIINYRDTSRKTIRDYTVHVAYTGKACQPLNASRSMGRSLVLWYTEISPFSAASTPLADW